MKIVTSKKTISFPQYSWGINENEERELPENKDAQKAILAHPLIEEVGKSKSRESVQKNDESDDEK